MDVQSIHNPKTIALAATFVLSSVIAAGQTVAIDASGGGRVFDGVGAISGGGGNSRLLIDYKEPYRSQILDYLFKPHYGASVQILKVEIGADMDSTDGAEASHMHTATDENDNRGYEWWLMEQAKARNPRIKLAALPWGAPHWVGNGNYWSKDMIDYTIKWLKHAQSDHHLTIDYIGGRNEKGYNVQWYKDFRAALRANGLASIKVVASDDWPKNSLWNIAKEMKNDAALNDAIDIVGAHGPGWGGYPPPEALSLEKPLWDSEAHYDEKLPFNEMARNINRNYPGGKVTAAIYWPIVSAIYDNLPYDNIGMIKCNQPWSGHYVVMPSIWAMAHTAQFTEAGWQYIDGASGFFNQDTTGAHGSFVTLKSPDKKNFSVIIETVTAKDPQTVRFSVTGFPKAAVHLWATDFTSSNSSDWFVKQSDIVPAAGQFSLTIKPGYVYSLTTTTGQTKGAFAASPAGAPFPIPFADNFDSYSAGKMPKYFADMYGGFETSSCAGGRKGGCLSQVVPAEPTAWKRTSNRPFTILGDLEWSNYRVSSDVLLEQPGAVDLIGRMTGMSGEDTPNSYVLRVSDTGSWSILKTSTKRNGGKPDEAELASGKASPLGVGAWHAMSLEFQGGSLIAKIDGAALPAVSDATYAKGMAGLGVVGYALAQFDNFKVEPLTPAR
jgi:O-glycosyl hydrolase